MVFKIYWIWCMEFADHNDINDNELLSSVSVILLHTCTVIHNLKNNNIITSEIV